MPELCDAAQTAVIFALKQHNYSCIPDDPLGAGPHVVVQHDADSAEHVERVVLGADGNAQRV